MLYKVVWGIIHIIPRVLDSAYLCSDKRVECASAVSSALSYDILQKTHIKIKTYDKVFYSEANKQGEGLHRG